MPHETICIVQLIILEGCRDSEKTYINQFGDCGHNGLHFVQQTLSCGLLVVEWEKVVLESGLDYIYGCIE